MKVLLVGWGCNNKKDSAMYQVFYTMLKRIFPDIDRFDSKEKYFQYGKDDMNNQLLNYLKINKFDMIIFAMDEDEFYPKTILSIEKTMPNTKKVFWITDDDTRFEHYSRYYALLFDAVITVTTPYYVKLYNQDGINNVYFHMGYNCYNVKKLEEDKKYDLTFIGRPKADRNDVIEYLLDKGININVFGFDWYKYPKLKNIYLGPLDEVGYNKVINQSKINLCFSNTGYSEEVKRYNLKGKCFEIALTSSFQLLEDYSEIFDFFKKDKEIVTFKNKEDLYNKIKYYLKNEREREYIAKGSYNRVITEHDRENQLREIFTKIINTPKEKIRINKSEKKSLLLTKEDLLDVNIKEKLKDYDYVHFGGGELKKQIQIYSLEKTKKNISCCDYYVGSNYMRLRTYFAFKRLGKEANKLINLEQLMFTKSFFLDNISKINKEDLLNNKNTAFVSIPFITLNKLNKIDYNSMLKAFDMTFLKYLVALKYQKRLSTSFPYKLLKPFSIRYLVSSYFDKHNRDKLKLNDIYLK